MERGVHVSFANISLSLKQEATTLVVGNSRRGHALAKYFPEMVTKIDEKIKQSALECQQTWQKEGKMWYFIVGIICFAVGGIIGAFAMSFCCIAKAVDENQKTLKDSGSNENDES